MSEDGRQAPLGATGAPERWVEIVEPMVRRFEVAAALPGHEASWNSTGSAACAKLIRGIASKLDQARTMISERDATIEHLLAEQATDRDLLDRAARTLRKAQDDIDRHKQLLEIHGIDPDESTPAT